MNRTLRRVAFLVVMGVLLSSGIAHAYVGPGGTLGAIGAALALLGAIVAAIVGFLWYPLKRLVTWIRGDREPTPAEPAGSSDIGPE